MGFSLLELVVVIAILMILVLLVGSSFFKIRDAAAAAKCASNLRVIGAATHAYVGDHNGYLPVGYVPGSISGEGYWESPVNAWYVNLAPYLNIPILQEPRDLGGPPYKRAIPRPTVFACPVHKMTVPIPDNVRPVSYAPVISSARDAPWIDEEVRRAKMASVLNPSRKIWIQDSLGGNIYNNNDVNYSIPNGPAYIPFLRHNNAVNALFFDGHVERVPFERVSPHIPTSEYPGIYFPFK